MDHHQSFATKRVWARERANGNCTRLDKEWWEKSAATKWFTKSIWTSIIQKYSDHQHPLKSKRRVFAEIKKGFLHGTRYHLSLSTLSGIKSSLRWDRAVVLMVVGFLDTFWRDRHHCRVVPCHRALVGRVSAKEEITDTVLNIWLASEVSESVEQMNFGTFWQSLISIQRRMGKKRRFYSTREWMRQKMIYRLL